MGVIAVATLLAAFTLVRLRPGVRVHSPSCPPAAPTANRSRESSPQVGMVHAEVEVYRHQGWLLAERADLDSWWQAHRRVTRTRAA